MGISVLNVQLNFGKEKCMSVIDSEYRMFCFQWKGSYRENMGRIWGLKVTKE